MIAADRTKMATLDYPARPIVYQCKRFKSRLLITGQQGEGQPRQGENR